MSNIDPYATTSALARGYQFAGQMQEDRARRTAGGALAQNDMQAAMNAMGSVGAIDDVAALQAVQQRRGVAERERVSEEQEQVRDFMQRGARALRAAPAAQREGIYQQLRPTLAQVYPPELLAQMDRSQKDDATLDSLIAALGGELEAPYANDRSGPNGSVLRPDRYTGQYSEAYSAPFDPRDGASPGYMWTDASRTRQVFIPGGPHDPAVAGARASATRAPRRTGGGGGSGGSRRAPAAAPTSARPPWEQYR